MKNTYTRTLFIRDIKEATFTVYIHDAVKWEATAKDGIKAEYKNVKAWDIIEGGEEAEEIEALLDAESVDEFHEYLVLHFTNGEKATFRNSHVDLFIR